MCYRHKNNDVGSCPADGRIFPEWLGGTIPDKEFADLVGFELDPTSDLISLISANPLAAADNFIVIMTTIWTELFGCTVSSDIK